MRTGVRTQAQIQSLGRSIKVEGVGRGKTAGTVEAGFKKRLQLIESDCNGKLEQHMWYTQH